MLNDITKTRENKILVWTQTERAHKIKEMDNAFHDVQ